MFERPNLRMHYLLLPLVVATLSGCSGPLMGIPGGALKGTEQPLPPPATGDPGDVMVLETRPEDPYSVNIGYVVLGGQYYIDPAPERTWYQHLAANPAVRVRFAGSELIHPAFAQRVVDPEILSQFETGRMVMRLTPRP